MKQIQPQIGDIIEVSTPKGLAYVQYTYQHNDPPRYGALIRVLPHLYQSRPSTFSDLVKQKERFLTFFPLKAAVARGIVEIVGNEDIPDHAQGLPLMRIPGSIDREGQVLNWWLWDGESEWKIEVLSDEQRDLSIAGVINDTMLVERIVKGWRPRNKS